jgi:hypothetical protein
MGMPFQYPGEVLPDGVRVTSVVTTVYVVEHVHGGEIVASDITTSKSAAERLRRFYEEMAALPDQTATPAE